MTVLEQRIEQEEQLLLGEMLDNVKRWRTAKANFAAVSAAYTDRYPDPATAEAKAAADPRRVQAQGFTAYYREEAQACASILTALALTNLPEELR